MTFTAPECSAPLAELSEDALGELRLREPDALRKLVRSLYRTHALDPGRHRSAPRSPQELGVPSPERWCVNTEDESESGRVYLELADATPARAARGMALLTKLVG